MPEITQYYKQQRVEAASGVGNLTSADIQAATQGNRELARAGEMMTEFGMAFLEKKKKAEYHDQLNTAKTQYLTRFFEHEQGLHENADTETYMPNLKAAQAEWSSGYKFTNKDAENEFNLWRPNEDLSQSQRVFNFKHQRDVQNYQDNWNLNAKEATRRASTALSDTSYQLELANGRDLFGVELNEDTGELQLVEDWENTLLDSDEVRMAGYKEWQADVDVRREKNIQEVAKETIKGEYQAVIEAGGTEKEGREVIDQAVKAKIISSDSKESLYSSLSSYTNQIQDNKRAKDTATNRSFVDMAQDNSLRLDDIYSAFPSDTDNGDIAQRNHWEKILKLSQRPDKLSKKTTTDGITDVMGLLAGLPTGEKTKGQVIEGLNNLYYVENEINKNTYDWAMGQFDKPYPAHVTKQLQSTLKAVDNNINFFWETAGEAKQIRQTQDAIMQNVSDNLLNWVDGEIAKDRVPGPKDIYQKATEFMVGARETEQKERDGITLSGQDQQAYDWAKKNPSDPRAKAILKKLGIK